MIFCLIKVAAQLPRILLHMKPKIGKIEKFGVSLSYLCANEDFYRGKNGKVSGYTEHTLCEIYFRYKIDSQYLLNQHILGLNPENNKQQNSAE